MIVTRILVVVPLVLVGACASLGDSDPAGPPAAAIPAVLDPDTDYDSREAASPTGLAQDPQPVDLPGREEAEELGRGFMDDPRFRKRFIESYLAETEIEPTVTEDERTTMVKVMDLVSAEKLDEAAAILEKELSPVASAVYDFTLGNIRFQQDRLDEATAAYRQAVEKFPKFRRAYGNMGQIDFRQRDHAGAVGNFSRVIELGGGDAITYGLLGVSHAGQGDHISAESAFRMAALLDPRTLDWKMGLAESFFRQGRYADAVSLFRGLIEKHPHRSDLWLAQGEAYARMGKTLEAAQNFEIVDRLGGSTEDSLNNLGDIYANQGLDDLAVEAYMRAMESNPEGSPGRAIRACRFLCSRGCFQEARNLVAGIERIHGDGLDKQERKKLLKLKARLAVAAGSGEEEAQVLEKIIQIDPLDGDALILLGLHSARKGDPQKAIFFYERAAGIEGFEADAKVRHAQLLVKLGRYQKALPLLRRAQELKPRENVRKYMEQVERVAGRGR